jgi:hypothetical protein
MSHLGAVAPGIEQRISNPPVGGSNPSSPADIKTISVTGFGFFHGQNPNGFAAAFSAAGPRKQAFFPRCSGCRRAADSRHAAPVPHSPGTEKRFLCIPTEHLDIQNRELRFESLRAYLIPKDSGKNESDSAPNYAPNPGGRPRDFSCATPSPACRGGLVYTLPTSLVEEIHDLVQQVADCPDASVAELATDAANLYKRVWMIALGLARSGFHDPRTPITKRGFARGWV